jgi:hypothetical protein
MRPWHLASWLIVGSLIWSLAVWSLACGTLLYPERREMEARGRIDPIVILMDGGLLLVFVIPGVIAFAVDIATGAIYEPEGDEVALGGDESPVRLTASQARVIELRLPPKGAAWRSDSVWWETGDGERIPTRILSSDSSEQPGRYRLESEAPLSPGPHRLVVSGVDGTEHAVPITVL